MSESTETGTLNISNASLFYTRTNPTAEQTLFLIHAGICDHRMWKAQVEHFSQDYQVITIDLYGFGQSTPPNQTFALHTDLIAVLDYFEVKNCWLIAASLGGAIAFDIVLMHPERILGMVMLAPAIAGFRYQGEPHPLVAKIDEADEAGDLALINEYEIQMWVDGTGRSADALDAEMRQLVLEMNLIALKADDDFWEYEVEIEPPALERLSEITVPVCLIYGDLDVPVSLERLDLIEQSLATVEKHLMVNTAHLPNMERPHEFNRIARTFIEKYS